MKESPLGYLMSKCAECGGEKVRKRRFCSRQCAAKFGRRKYQEMLKQKRKQEAYDKSYEDDA